jgi:hypothetical protein
MVPGCVVPKAPADHRNLSSVSREVGHVDHEQEREYASDRIVRQVEGTCVPA